jgi:hypothetical protein
MNGDLFDLGNEFIALLNTGGSLQHQLYLKSITFSTTSQTPPLKINVGFKSDYSVVPEFTQDLNVYTPVPGLSQYTLDFVTPTGRPVDMVLDNSYLKFNAGVPWSTLQWKVIPTFQFPKDGHRRDFCYYSDIKPFLTNPKPYLAIGTDGTILFCYDMYEKTSRYGGLWTYVNDASANRQNYDVFKYLNGQFVCVADGKVYYGDANMNLSYTDQGLTLSGGWVLSPVFATFTNVSDITWGRFAGETTDQYVMITKEQYPKLFSTVLPSLVNNPPTSPFEIKNPENRTATDLNGNFLYTTLNVKNNTWGGRITFFNGKLYKTGTATPPRKDANSFQDGSGVLLQILNFNKRPVFDDFLPDGFEGFTNVDGKVATIQSRNGKSNPVLQTTYPYTYFEVGRVNFGSVVIPNQNPYYPVIKTVQPYTDHWGWNSEVQDPFPGDRNTSQWKPMDSRDYNTPRQTWIGNGDVVQVRYLCEGNIPINLP